MGVTDTAHIEATGTLKGRHRVACGVLIGIRELREEPECLESFVQLADFGPGVAARELMEHGRETSGRPVEGPVLAGSAVTQPNGATPRPNRPYR